MPLNEALNDQRIKHGYLPALLVQAVGQGQIIGARSFHHKLAVRPAILDQLLKASFAIADFQVLDLVMQEVTDGERDFAHVNADDGKRQGGIHSEAG